MKKILLSLLGVLTFMAIPMSGAFAATSADVTVTATPTYIAITNSEATWAIGTTTANTIYWWTAAGTAPDPEPFEAADMKSTITNTGSVDETISVHAHNFTGGVGWTLHGTTEGENIVVLAAGTTGTANVAGMKYLVDTTPQELIHSLAAAGTQLWCLRLKTGTFTDGVGKSTSVTVSCAAH